MFSNCKDSSPQPGAAVLHEISIGKDSSAQPGVAVPHEISIGKDSSAQPGAATVDKGFSVVLHEKRICAEALIRHLRDLMRMIVLKEAPGVVKSEFRIL